MTTFQTQASLWKKTLPFAIAGLLLIGSSSFAAAQENATPEEDTTATVEQTDDGWEQGQGRHHRGHHRGGRGGYGMNGGGYGPQGGMMGGGYGPPRMMGGGYGGGYGPMMDCQRPGGPGQGMGPNGDENGMQQGRGRPHHGRRGQGRGFGSEFKEMLANENLSADDVKSKLEERFSKRGKGQVSISNVSVSDDVITAEIVRKITLDRKTGRPVR